jgi:radical SAM-linked protein
MESRVRIRFRKTGDLRFASHRDLMYAMERLFRRACVAVRESEGFHPKPKMHYPASLALGMVGLDEVLEAELAEEFEPEVLVNRLNLNSVHGLEFFAAEVLPRETKKGPPRSLEIEVMLPSGHLAEMPDRINRFVAADSWPIDRDGKSIDIRPLVPQLSLDGCVLSMQLRVVPEAGARPREVLQALGLSVEEILELDTTRTRVEMAP